MSSIGHVIRMATEKEAIEEQESRWAAGVRFIRQPNPARFARDEKHLERRTAAMGAWAFHELARSAALDAGGRAAQRISQLAKARARRRRKRKATGR